MTALAAALLASGLLLWHFHDRYWYPTDDGFFAHIAERLVSGEVLHRDVQDIHPGYIHFLNALALRAFGADVVSLRYPLVAAGVLQVLPVFLLMRQRGPLLAATVATAGTAVGIVQFVDPTPNWYSLTLAIVLAWWLHSATPSPRKLLVAGFIVGTIAMLRQLSGVWAAMGTLTFALWEVPSERGHRVILARAVFLVMLLALCWYLIVSPETEPGGVLLIALWPLLLLIWSIARTNTSDRATLVTCGWLGAGGALPILPALLYHLVHGSVGAWTADTIFAAFGLTQMPFFGRGWYGVLPLAALYQVVTATSFQEALNGVYWVVLPVLFAVNGALLLRDTVRTGRLTGRALPLLAAFYAQVSLFFEGPLYLYYSAGLVVAAVAWRTAQNRRSALIVCVPVALLGTVALQFHAGQSRHRTPMQILRGDRITDTWGPARTSGLARARVAMDAGDRDVYREVVEFIRRESSPGDSILVLPNDAELYFLAERRNPTWFYNSAFGLRSRASLARMVDRLGTAPPRLVIFKVGDKYETPLVIELMEHVRSRASFVRKIGDLEFYRLTPAA